MSPNLLHRSSSQYRTTDSELAAGLRKALDNKYARILQLARREWELGFGRPDPSDACVSVRISGVESARALPGRNYLTA